LPESTFFIFFVGSGFLAAKNLAILFAGKYTNLWNSIPQATFFYVIDVVHNFGEIKKTFKATHQRADICSVDFIFNFP
jgi:hypothetical protein